MVGASGARPIMGVRPDAPTIETIGIVTLNESIKFHRTLIYADDTFKNIIAKAWRKTNNISRPQESLGSGSIRITRESIIDQTFPPKISPNPSFSKRGIPPFCKVREGGISHLGSTL